MSAPIAMPDDLGTYLGDPNIDPVRATLVLQLAQDLCETILTPLPDGALGIVLGVAARAFTNAQNVMAESVGPFSVQHGQGVIGSGGLYLSRADKLTLRRLAGRGGAFSIDPTPVDAGQGLPLQDQNVTWLEGIPLIEDQRR